jgi:hypothetical protein
MMGLEADGFDVATRLQRSAGVISMFSAVGRIRMGHNFGFLLFAAVLDWQILGFEDAP